MSLSRKFLTGSAPIMAAFLAAAGLLLAAGCSSPTNSSPPAFVAVTGITGVPTGGTAGTQVDLSAAVVVPGNANNKDIVWTVKEAGGAGVTTAGIVDYKFTPATPGTVKLTATIVNGTAQGTDYAQDFDILIAASGAFVPATNITGVPTGGTTGGQVDLSGAAVYPSNATNKDIVWSVKDPGGTGVSAIAGGKFTPATAGTLVLTATIANGSAEGTVYAQDFTITITAPGNFVAVADITGVPTGGFTGTEVDLTGAVVTPENATNKTILWTVKDADTTGVGDSALTGGKFTPASAGTLVLTATIANGSAQSAAYVKNFEIIISPAGNFVPVTNITGVPTGGTTGTEVDLSAATVVPGNADNKTIVWSVKNDGGTGLTTADVAGGKFTPANPGTVKLTATIANGSALGTDYAQDFDIVISTAGSFVAVTDITGVPDEGIAEQPVSLAGAVVVPDTATYQTIVWRVKSGGGLSAGNIDGNSFTPTETGSVVIEAVISSAAGNMTPFTKEFTITIKAAFTAVTGIDGLADRNAVTGTLVNLNAGLTVQPATATNKTIVWSVTTAGATGLTTSDVEGGSFTPANAGTATLTATILNGRAQGSDYTQDITLTIIKPVTAISGVPTSGTKGQSISLAGAQAEPSDASNKTIVWTVNDAGGTGVTTANLAGGTFTPANAGSLKLTATIANGSAIGTAFVNTYTITVSDPGSFTPGFDLGDDTSIQLTDSLSRELSKDTPNTVTKDSAYYVVIKGNYTDVVWRLNGNPQNVPGSLIYLPTDTLQTINLSVEGKKDGKLESSGSYTFTITN